jgi:DNA-directed RNA polymerase subunit RPC12/RpoP
MMDELRPCPFCEIGVFEYDNDTGFNDESYYEYYECNNCGARVSTKELASARPIEDKLRARIKELEDELKEEKDRFKYRPSLTPLSDPLDKITLS